MSAPAFGGYVALPRGSGDAVLVAWWNDGRGAVFKSRYDGALGRYVEYWFPLPAADYAALFPAPTPPAPVADAPEAVRYGLGRGDGRWWCVCGDHFSPLPASHMKCSRCGTLNPSQRP